MEGEAQDKAVHGSTAQKEQNRPCLAEGFQLLVALTSKTEFQTVAKLETYGGSYLNQ